MGQKQQTNLLKTNPMAQVIGFIELPEKQKQGKTRFSMSEYLETRQQFPCCKEDDTFNL